MSEFPDLERGREAHRRRMWSDAYTSLSEADVGTSLGADDLRALALSAYMVGRDAEWRSGMERAHRAAIEAGDTMPAARDAFWLGFYLASRGETGPASGWLARATRLVEDAGGDCAERGYLLLPVVLQRRMTGEYDAAHGAAAEAARIGERFGDPDLLGWARHEQGRALVRQGRVGEGMELLDEAMLSVAVGECSPLATGQIYCSVIEACLEVDDLSRAQQWTTALTQWCEEQPGLVTYAGQCLVHRAEIMLVHGGWRDALVEARRASERLSGSADHPVAGSALYEQAEVHRLFGDLAESEKAYRAADRAGFQPQPGLSLLRVVQGRSEAAAATIRRVLGETTGPLPRARLLPATVEIMLAVGDVGAARAACRELAEITEDYGTEMLVAKAAYARGRVELADSDAHAALGPARRASQAWQSLGAPYETARARELLALACRTLGDEDGAALELEAARSAYVKLGAGSDLARVDQQARRISGESHGLTRRELEVLRLVAGGTTNKSIGAELRLSEKTVDRHVSNILAKLAVSSRTAATAYAFQHDLV